jgi:thioredoxin reductase (NADPH)
MADEAREVIIIGSGPAGYTAAVYAARGELKPLMFAGEKGGGQLMLTTEVENYPGFPEGLLGPDLMMKMRDQAEKFGTEIVDRNVTEVDFGKRPFVVKENEQSYQAKTVIIATGAEAKLLGVPGEQELLGRGVSTCAVCDAAFYRDKVTFVVGGGDAAIEEALALTKYAKKVTMLVRREDFKASRIMASRAKEHSKIEIWWNHELREVKGKGKVERLVVEDNKTQERKEVEADGVFVAVGHRPMTDLFRGKVELDEKGYLMTHLNGKRQESAEDVWLNSYPTMTSVEGVFGAGDVVDFRYRQAITSAGFGCMAALDVEKFLGGVGGGSW